MRKPAAALLVLAALLAGALALAACGDDDDETTTPATTTTGATGATGAQDAEGASYDVTAGEFTTDLAIPDMTKAVEDFVADNPDACADADPEPGGKFQQGVAIEAASVSPDTPLSEVILRECEEEG